MKKGSKELNDRQRRFAAEYVIDFNATQAAIRAGYSEKTAGQIGFELLKKPEIQELIRQEIEARSIRTKITQDRVLEELARIAFFDVRKLVDADGNPIKVSQIDEDTARAIVGLDVVTIGNADVGVGSVTKFKMSDKRAALVDIGKHLGMFIEKKQISGPGGGPLMLANVSADELTDEELAAILSGAKHAE